MFMTCMLSGCAVLEDEKSGNADLVDTSGYACIKVYTVKEPGTTDEAIAAVEELINKITLKEFKTKVKIMAFEDSEYLDAIQEAKDGLDELAAKAKEEKAAARAESKRLSKLKETDYEAYRKEMLAKQREAKRLAAEKAEEEAKLMAEAEAAGIEYIPEIAVPEYAIDVMLVRNVQELLAFKQEGDLKNISEYLSLDYKSISKTIHPTLLDMGKVGKSTFAVVNNNYAGTSQYAVFDTEIYEKYSDKIVNLNGLVNLRAFLDSVKNNEEGIIPLLNLPEFVPDGDYLTDTTNPIGVYNADFSSGDEVYTVSNLFSLPAYQAHFNSILTFRRAGYLPDAGAEVADDARFAVKFVTGDEYDKKELEEQGYTVLTFTKPRITNENCNLSFYGIYTSSSYPTRAMKFIEMLTTNPELQTAFAYGVEGVHYEVTDDGRVERLNGDYNIDLSYVGNRFIGLPTVDENVDIFDIARERNQNVKISALYGKDLDYSFDYLESYAKEKISSNLASAARAAAGEKFKTFITGDYVEDKDSKEYVNELRAYCLAFAVSGGIFMVSPYNEDKGGYIVGNTARAKISGIETAFNGIVTPEMLPAELESLMRNISTVSETELNAEIKDLALITDSDMISVTVKEDARETKIYSVYPLFYQGENIGMICMATVIDDTVTKLEEILAEYWDDIIVGIPNSSIDRFSAKIIAEIEEAELKKADLNAQISATTDEEEKASLRAELEKIPSAKDTIKGLISAISKDADVVDGYATELTDLYNKYKNGSLDLDGYTKKVHELLEDDFIQMWSVWDEITDMNERFTEETNITFLLDVLNKLYSK